jgi:hypothetical protein
MRLLNEMELEVVCGAEGVCTPSNSYGGVTNTGSVGQDLIKIYEGLVNVTSHVIERVANALR